jgi:DNA polymerase III delta prime subunit
MDNVRENTIQDLINSNDYDDLQQMQRELEDLIEASDEEQVEDLARYRLGILEDAINRINNE